MTSFVQLPSSTRRTGFFGTLTQAFRTWSRRQIWTAIAAAVVVAVVIGVATVLIPNSLFTRDIPPVWWNYPVWLLTAALSGVLIGTYVRPTRTAQTSATAQSTGDGDDSPPQAAQAPEATTDQERSERRTSRMGMAGGVLAWFAVGCPVCNKIALVALGYSGAITYFTPIQPFLAVGAMLLTGVAVVVRLRGQVSCPVARPTAR